MNAWCSSCRHSPSTMSRLAAPPAASAHDRENLHAVRRGLGRHRNRLQPVREGAAQAGPSGRGSVRGRDGSVRRGGGDQPRANGPTAGASRECYPGRVRENALVDGGAGGKRAHLLAAVRPDEPCGEDHLLVHRLLRHGARLSRTRSVRRAKPPRVVRDRRPRQRKSTPPRVAKGSGDDSTPTSLLAGRPPRARQVIGELLLARSSVLRAGTNDARRPRPPHTAARRSRDLVLVRSLAMTIHFFARARAGADSRTLSLARAAGRVEASREERVPRAADARLARAAQHVFPPQPGQARPPGAEALREEHARGARGEAPQRGTRAEPRRASPFVSPRGFGPRPPARRERDPPRRSIDVTLGVSIPITTPRERPLAEGNVPEPRSESGLAQPPLTARATAESPSSSLAQVEGSCTGRHGFTS